MTAGFHAAKSNRGAGVGTEASAICQHDAGQAEQQAGNAIRQVVAVLAGEKRTRLAALELDSQGNDGSSHHTTGVEHRLQQLQQQQQEQQQM
jgi:hypothetical protein